MRLCLCACMYVSMHALFLCASTSSCLEEKHWYVVYLDRTFSAIPENILTQETQ